MRADYFPAEDTGALPVTDFLPGGATTCGFFILLLRFGNWNNSVEIAYALSVTSPSLFALIG